MLAPPTTYLERWEHVTMTCISIDGKSTFYNTSRTHAAVRAISKNLHSKIMREPISVSSNTRVGAFIQPQGKKQVECMNRDARTELVVHAYIRAGKDSPTCLCQIEFSNIRRIVLPVEDVATDLQTYGSENKKCRSTCAPCTTRGT